MKWGTMAFRNVSIRQVTRYVGLSEPEIVGLPFKSPGW